MMFHSLLIIGSFVFLIIGEINPNWIWVIPKNIQFFFNKIYNFYLKVFNPNIYFLKWFLERGFNYPCGLGLKNPNFFIFFYFVPHNNVIEIWKKYEMENVVGNPYTYVLVFFVSLNLPSSTIFWWSPLLSSPHLFIVPKLWVQICRNFSITIHLDNGKRQIFCVFLRFSRFHISLFSLLFFFSFSNHLIGIYHTIIKVLIIHPH